MIPNALTNVIYFKVSPRDLI